MSQKLDQLTRPDYIGYHLTPIAKGVLGDFSKIEEEFLEFKDAYLQKNKILCLVELSDLIGAIEHYVIKNIGLSLDDLINMNMVTQRAFKNGRRN